MRILNLTLISCLITILILCAIPVHGGCDFNCEVCRPPGDPEGVGCYPVCCGGGGDPPNDPEPTPVPPTPTPIPYLSSFDVACQFAQNTGGVERLASDAQPFIISSLQVAPPTYSSGGASCPTVATPACRLTDDTGVTLHTGSYGATKCVCHYEVPPSTCIGSNTPLKVSTTSLSPCFQTPDPAQTANLFNPVVGYDAIVSHDCTAVGPWIKTMNASFVRGGSSPLVNDRPFIIDSFDQTDTDLSGASGGASGVVTNIDIGEMGPLSKEGWTLSEYPVAPVTGVLIQHATTLLRTMPYHASVPVNGRLTLSTTSINVLDPSQASDIKSFELIGTGTSIVLIVTDGANLGALTLTGSSYNTVNSKSLLILSSTVTFVHTGAVQMHGVVIADQIDTGVGSTLKVTGNLICAGDPNGCIRGRSRADQDHARPSVLIRLDPDQYLHLLPYLGRLQGEWSER